MQKPRKPVRPAGFPRTYVLEVRGKSRIATRSDFAFAWHDYPDLSELNENEPITATISGIRHVARLRGGVLRWVKPHE